MICRYCELIHSKDESYPLREATKDLESEFPRCDWHWRYVCDVCGRPRHFNAVGWCRKAEKFVCLFCGVDHRFVEGKFWGWDAYYAIGCPYCGERHPALDRLEFQEEHPWLLNPEMLEERSGLSLEEEARTVYSSRSYPSEGVVLDDGVVGEAWDRFADTWNDRYSEFGDKNRQYLIDPCVFRVLGDVEGRRVLDAGCGNGYLSRLLSRKGAEVVGVDLSKRFIEIAESLEQKKPLGIEYRVGSVCDLSMLDDCSFDFVVCNIVLDDLQDLDRAGREVYRVLKVGGKLVFSILHPCFTSPPVHGWVREPVDTHRKGEWLYWKVDRYFERSVGEWRYYDHPSLYSFHRPLSDYMKLLLENGFRITDFEEPVPDEKDVEEHYRQFGDECDRIAWFLVVGAEKDVERL
jgi:SAM-dependent methyltransferase